MHGFLRESKRESKDARVTWVDRVVALLVVSLLFMSA